MDPYRVSPNQKAINDFEKLDKRLQELIKATLNGHGQTMRFTFEVPLEYVTLAAWLGLRKYAYQRRQRLPIDFSDVVETPLNKHDLKSAGGYMENALDEFFMKEYHDLCTHYHLYLYDRPLERTEQTTSEKDLPF